MAFCIMKLEKEKNLRYLNLWICVLLICWIYPTNVPREKPLIFMITNSVFFTNGMWHSCRRKSPPPSFEHLKTVKSESRIKRNSGSKHVLLASNMWCFQKEKQPFLFLPISLKDMKSCKNILEPPVLTMKYDISGNNKLFLLHILCVRT